MGGKRFLPAFVLVFVVVLWGCKDVGSEPSPVTPAPSGTVSFAADVLPIFRNAGCMSCHGDDGGLSVRTVAHLLAGGDHGPAIIPGKADSSILVRKLLTPPPFGARMPAGGAQLPEQSITVLRNWINQGAANN